MVSLSNTSVQSRERERDRLSFERQFYTVRFNEKIGGECIYGFPMVRGPWCNSKLKLAALKRIEKIDFRETLLSYPQAASCGERERERVQSRDSRANGTCIATDSNPERYWIRYGFPRPRMPFCNTLLKAKILDRYIRIPRISQPGELVYSTQTEGFPLAPLSRGQR